MPLAVSHVRFLIVVALGALAGVVGHPRPAVGCSCVLQATPCQARHTPILFVGEVVSVREAGNSIQHRVRVIRAVKGIHTGAITDVWSNTSSCGTRLQVGARYVIATTSSNGRLSVGACDWLEALAPGESEPELPPVPGRVYGRISRWDPNAFANHAPVAGARLWLDLPAGRVTAVSDRFGRFAFADVPRGTHRLEVDAGRHLELSGPRHVQMPSAAGCVASFVFLRPSGRLTGRVVHADRRPASGTTVSLLRVEPPAGTPTRYAASTGAAADGRFTFVGIDPGTYVVAVNPADAPSVSAPIAARWFGGNDGGSAARIRVDAGAAELARPLVLPAPLRTRTLTLSVTCRDGSTPPFVDARATGVAGAAGVEVASARGATTTLRLLRDRAYSVVVTPVIPYDALGPRGPSPRGTLPAIHIPAGAPGQHIALVAPFTGCTAPR